MRLSQPHFHHCLDRPLAASQRQPQGDREIGNVAWLSQAV